MTENSAMYGQACWLEVPVTSASRAAAFYTAVLGWDCPVDCAPAPVVGVKSVHFFNKGPLHGAFLLMPDEDAVVRTADPKRLEKSATVTSFMVANIEETLKKVEAAGGKCHIPKTEIGGGMGVFARFIDTEGNLQGIWAKE